VDTKHISGTAEARIVKFCTSVDCVVSWLMDDKSPLKGAWSGLHEPLTPAIISPETAEARVPKFCVYVEYLFIYLSSYTNRNDNSTKVTK